MRAPWVGIPALVDRSSGVANQSTASTVGSGPEPVATHGPVGRASVLTVGQSQDLRVGCQRKTKVESCILSPDGARFRAYWSGHSVLHPHACSVAAARSVTQMKTRTQYEAHHETSTRSLIRQKWGRGFVSVHALPSVNSPVCRIGPHRRQRRTGQFSDSAVSIPSIASVHQAKYWYPFSRSTQTGPSHHSLPSVM